MAYDSKPSTSYTADTEPILGRTMPRIGNPLGLLLVLTYAANIPETGVTYTYDTKTTTSFSYDSKPTTTY